MRASKIEFRLRMVIQIVIVFVGFWSPWIGAFDMSRRVSTLEWLALEISRAGIAGFKYSAPMVIVAGALFTLAGAVFRVWGAAYLGYDVVHHAQMQAGGVMAAGPYRHLRNPLYLGGWCMMIGVCLLMPPTGALFTMILITVFYLRLILGEEAFLTAQLGEPYREFLRSVPRLMPRLHSKLPRAAAQPHWLVAIVTELNAIGIFATIAILSWTYNNLLMIKAIVIVFGVSLLVRAFMPRGDATPKTA